MPLHVHCQVASAEAGRSGHSCRSSSRGECSPPPPAFRGRPPPCSLPRAARRLIHLALDC
eukprot:7683107-Pyramimonas_sp.AAC.1